MTDKLSLPLDVRLMNLSASLLFTGCAALVLVAGVWWLLRHPGLAMARIVVQGDLVHNNAVTLRANVVPHLVGNFFTLDLHAARAAFEQVPWVRRAQLRRAYPGSLLVQLQEHEALAYWGPESGSALVNRQGEVFEANLGDIEQEGLPHLLGPAGSAPEVLRMHGLLQSAFAALELDLRVLELTGRGGWRATLGDAAVVELGGGTQQEVLQRAQRFVRTLAPVATKYGRRVQALEFADLRHAGGYALRLRGVSTVGAQGASAQRQSIPGAGSAGRNARPTRQHATDRGRD
ncbi:cell division protein FtsQ/DivIB [Verminephrobacter aporrectodeae]|uniref:Cell division protein FtsQ n=1 Tax=Verminephrobacter aporrectodeae subsp. tuberculatae TaxID=1110392 RepID=A0ABT3KRU3_9BURK|nr:cell division protein FtsQ/DivIB [Verminephrobacter aporrectodeae]MCW5219994.1 FtsQ-type POTRA domain-containing protein [Verminephrobacter aporrectodeae subsp. tuberculatae]MCW5256042.1 FtsQ-type POTRA domain-containing protein [Verminephrobacter aporrectodeae subsp. tuberculatae]MCW5289282.1 FtsQ-type POTRA domain-containing protein [Verminephrobacter aporrectodeae subsp. tuberculatae]MCW5321048.1 FtsQ-type POTRA domain-containing protein [Verminephrobacter aporrectodeae subsp. tuberculata